MGQRLLLTNCRLYDAEDDKEKVSILVEDSCIKKIGDVEAEAAFDVLDAEGRIAAPGFIDVHIQGAGGADILDGTEEALKAISQTCAQYGVTSFLATTVYRADGDNGHLELAAECAGSDLGGADLLGIHLEGPFIAANKKGMIQPDCVCAASAEVLAVLLGGDDAAMQLAEEIVAYREGLLYGMESIAEIMEMEIMSIDTFKKIADSITTRSDVYTIRCFATAERARGDGLMLQTEAVVDRIETPYEILYWYQGASN